MAQTFLNNSTSRGLRNNNPGNIRRGSDVWQGEVPYKDSKDAEFEQFYELAWGIRAYYKLIINYMKGGTNTLTKIISKYAPSNENNTQAYITQVATAMGVSKDAVLNDSKTIIVAMAKAMFHIEIGASEAKKITSQNYEDAWFYLNSSYGSGDLPNLDINSDKRCKYCGHFLLIVGLFFFTYLAISF